MAMADLTLQQAIDLTREIMDAVGATEWSDATLRTWVGLGHWAEWADLLNTNNQYYMQTVTASQDSDGRIAMTSLNTGSGNTAKYWYRILSISPNQGAGATSAQFYRFARYKQFPQPQPNTSMPYVWYPFGRNVQLVPIQSGQSMFITVNYRPTRADKLNATSDVIDFPDGYAEVIPWRAAKMALLKGGSEVQAANDIWKQGQILHDSMLLDLGRESTWPIIADAFDDPAEWGG